MYVFALEFLFLLFSGFRFTLKLYKVHPEWINAYIDDFCYDLALYK